MARFLLWIYIIFSLLLLYSNAAMVGYVHNAACASDSGCDFNSAIWNITGVPSAGDTVSIYSNETITINIRNSNISLNTLMAGYDNSSNVTLALYNSVLNITAKDTMEDALVWNYHLYIQYSTLRVFPYGYATGKKLTSIGGRLVAYDLQASLLALTDTSLSINRLYADSLTAMNSDLIRGTWANWYIDSVQLVNSTIDIYSLDVDIISANDSFLYFDDYLTVRKSAIISRGEFVGGISLKSYAFANLTNVPTTADVECYGNNSHLSFVAANPITTPLVLRDVYCPTSLQNTVSIGDQAIVSVTSSGYFTGLTLGRQVTMNFRSQDSKTTDIIISHQDSTTQMNLLDDNVVFYARQQLLANINSLPAGTLTVKENLAVSGAIKGGEIDLYDVTLTCDHIDVDSVEVLRESQIVTNQFNVSEIDLHSNLLINAPATFISSPGLTLFSYILSVNGNFTQIGGAIDISGEYGQFITVNGSVFLSDVVFKISAFTYLVESKKNFTLIRSLTGSITVHDCSYVATGGSSSTERLAIVGGDLILLYAEFETSGVSQLNVGWTITFILLLLPWCKVLNLL